MNTSITLFTGMILLALTACSTQPAKQEAAETKVIPVPEKPVVTPEEALQQSGQNPDMTITKEGKKLNLVKIMDGGVCKNSLEGAKGEFLVYAYPADIERIKREKGAKIFADFENKIQALSTDALQHAVGNTNLSKDPFALGNDAEQHKLAQQLSENFHNAVAPALKAFKKETTLTIDVTAFPPSFIFYQQGCETATLEPENEGAENPVK